MKKLLIVDDQAGILMLLCEIFKTVGYKTFSAANGIEAKRLVNAEQPDCIILDMQMPGMNGIDFFKNLNAKWPGIPVILITANDRTDIPKELLENVSDVFIKPFDIKEVLATVKQLLES